MHGYLPPQKDEKHGSASKDTAVTSSKDFASSRIYSKTGAVQDRPENPTALSGQTLL